MKYDLSYCPAPNRREEVEEYPPPTISDGRLAVRYQMSKNLCQRNHSYFFATKFDYSRLCCSSVLIITQPAFTCSKLTIETLKEGVKYVQSKQRYHNDAGFVLVSLLLTLNM